MADAALRGRTITVFGGTGFLGRRIVRALARRGCTVRVAARHPAIPEGQGDIHAVAADLRDHRAVSEAVAGAAGVVNAVSLYEEKGGVSFADIHVAGARRVAEAALKHGVRRLVHLSGIGADPSAQSPYIRARGRGEEAVRDAYPSATIFRPSAMFGPDDALLSALLELTRMPVVPLFGRGDTRLQPVDVGDVAEAAARVSTETAEPAALYALGGPRVCTYRELVETVLRATGRRRLLLPVPFAAWDMLAGAARLLPSPPISEGQVALMKADNVANADLPGLEALGIEPRTLEAALARRLGKG